MVIHGEEPFLEIDVTVQFKNNCNIFMALSAGIEPATQLPESYVISISPREHTNVTYSNVIPLQILAFHFRLIK